MKEPSWKVLERILKTFLARKGHSQAVATTKPYLPAIVCEESHSNHPFWRANCKG